MLVKNSKLFSGKSTKYSDLLLSRKRTLNFYSIYQHTRADRKNNFLSICEEGKVYKKLSVKAFGVHKCHLLFIPISYSINILLAFPKVLARALRDYKHYLLTSRKFANGICQQRSHFGKILLTNETSCFRLRSMEIISRSLY